MRVIQSLKVVSQGQAVQEYRVGEELHGEAIIEIRRMRPGKYMVLNENGDRLAIIEKCSTIAEYVDVAEEG